MTGRATQLAPSCAPTAFDTVNAHHRSACGEASPHPARTGSCGKRPCHPASILTGQGTAAPALLRVFRARVSLPRASDRGTSGTSAWSTNQVTVRPPRCRQPHRSASLSTIPSPRPSSASAPAGRSSGSPGPLRSATSTRTAPAPTVTVTVTVSPGRPELLWRRLLAKSSLASNMASSPQGCPGPSTAPTNKRTTRTRSTSPATFTLSRTVTPVISSPPSRRPGRPAGGRTDAQGNARSPQPPSSSRLRAAGGLPPALSPATCRAYCRRKPGHPGRGGIREKIPPAGAFPIARGNV